jgi:hypothetical protein
LFQLNQNSLEKEIIIFIFTFFLSFRVIFIIFLAADIATRSLTESKQEIFF